MHQDKFEDIKVVIKNAIPRGFQGRDCFQLSLDQPLGATSKAETAYNSGSP
jgi:hypothetical protein